MFPTLDGWLTLFIITTTTSGAGSVSKPAQPPVADGRKIRLDGARRANRDAVIVNDRRSVADLRRAGLDERLVPLGVVTAEVIHWNMPLLSEQTQARNMVVQIATLGRTIRSIGNPVKTGAAEASGRRRC